MSSLDTVRTDLPHGGLDGPPLDAAAGRQPYPLLFMTVSGAHLYGFPSPDSDADLRGVHLLPAEEVVGLATPRETVETTEVRDGLELDVVTHDLGKFLRLLLKPNGYVLEQLTSPLVVRTSAAHEAMLELARDVVTRRHRFHYLGFAATQWRLATGTSRVKPLLYTYRALLTGLHLLRTGRVEADLRRLNAEAGLPAVDDLVAAKRAGAEKMTIEPAELAGHEARVLRLRAELEAAGDTSPLPEQPGPGVRDAFERLLVELRLGRRSIDERRATMDR
jgi:predicted nucleotidyltransferase